MAKLKSRAQKFADLIEPSPKDFDPEEDNPSQASNDSSSEDSDDGLAGTEHYTDVAKSKLRKPEEVALGPQYAGSQISREALIDDDYEVTELDRESSSRDNGEGRFADPEDLDIDVDDEDGDIDSDAAFGDSDLEKFKGFTFRGSEKPWAVNGKKGRSKAADFMSDSGDDAMETDEDILETAGQHSEESGDEVFSTARQYAEDNSEEEESVNREQDESGSEDDDLSSEDEGNEAGSQPSEDEDGETSRRAELRKIMNEEQKTVVATISQAAKADADKGNAVKAQRKTFDSLLSVRMVMQKALIATNSLAATSDEKDDAENQPYEAAEVAAIKLWNTLDSLRSELLKAKTGQKRKRDIETTTTSSKIWERMQSSEVSMIDTRQTTLEKWSAKVRGSTAVPLTRKLNPNAGTQSITLILQDQLANSEHLVKRTKMPRSCAPVQRELKIMEDPKIYDDGNFYQMLLKELVEQRRVESLTAPAVGSGNVTAPQWTAVKEAKAKKNVDTKASKGRKMRYTVHEKLQNFMAPEDRGSWEPEAIDRFFGTLLGQKMTLGEDEMDVDSEEKVLLEEEGLKLFRSS
ncbi:apoptosis-antagonizing transcription factor [Tricladium varicosporioides]|nr:apoptosis-antagonizing transcription factor [Hymenoscyphus varicosporioides]